LNDIGTRDRPTETSTVHQSSAQLLASSTVRFSGRRRKTCTKTKKLITAAPLQPMVQVSRWRGGVDARIVAIRVLMDAILHPSIFNVRMKARRASVPQHGNPSLDCWPGRLTAMSSDVKAHSAAWFNPTFEQPAVGTRSIPDDNEKFWRCCDFAIS
jgi:hypothetical protein